MTDEGTIAGRAAADSVSDFFGRFATIVLVANSDAVDMGALSRAHGPETLFVFFNKVYKVLSAPFAGRSLLVARSGPAGANIVYRREVGDVLRLVAGPGFTGILNVRAGTEEVFSPAADFAGAPVGHLDLVASAAGFYPSSHVPTSGFALALFLSETCPSSRIVLAGFTAKRSLKWRLFEDHDWTFEQIVLRLLFGSGRLHVAAGSPGGEAGSLAQIAARLDGVTPAEVALVTAEVLAERLDTANSAIDRLIKLTRFQDRIGGWARTMKPKTRKMKLAEKAGEGS